MVGDNPTSSTTRKGSARHRKAKARLSGRQKVARGSIVLGLVIVLLAGSVAYYFFHLYGQIHKLNVGNLTVNTDSSQPINILLVGSNSRQVLSASEAKYFGSGAQVGGARSDVTMIAHLDPKTGQVSILSIPRDLFVPIPGKHIANRVDDALNVSPSQLVNTVEQDLGIPIQHFVELNFDTFQKVVQSLGGLKMYFPMPVKDAYSGLNITTPGCILLNGFQALEVVRARHLYYEKNGVWIEDPLGDLSRIRRDHEFLKVLADQVKQRGISNPFTLTSIISSIVPYLQVDSGFTLSNMIGIASKFRHANPNTVATSTLPISLVNNFTYQGASYGDVVFPTEPQDSQLISQSLGINFNEPASAKAVPVAVLNGSGIAGQAAQVSATLRQDGFKIAKIGNATVQSTPSETIIRYEPGYISTAIALRSTMSGSVIMGQAPTLSGAKVEVVTGNQLTVVNTVQTTQTTTAQTGSAGSSSSSSVTTPTTIPITVPSTLSHTPLQPWDPRACPA
ncbi:MAG: LCP family protein [Acidimicrobiaceae bacterium]|nr:LCP family protein [Acidimicrobiaceae bacterium]